MCRQIPSPSVACTVVANSQFPIIGNTRNERCPLTLLLSQCPATKQFLPANIPTAFRQLRVNPQQTPLESNLVCAPQEAHKATRSAPSYPKKLALIAIRARCCSPWPPCADPMQIRRDALRPPASHAFWRPTARCQ